MRRATTIRRGAKANSHLLKGRKEIMIKANKVKVLVPEIVEEVRIETPKKCNASCKYWSGRIVQIHGYCMLYNVPLSNSKDRLNSIRADKCLLGERQATRKIN